MRKIKTLNLKGTIKYNNNLLLVKQEEQGFNNKQLLLKGYKFLNKIYNNNYRKKRLVLNNYKSKDKML